MKTIGVILIVIGIVGILYFGFQAIDQSESFSMLGVDVAVSSANWTPVIVSAVVVVVGILLKKR
ncbi:MAG: hypothetical protein ACQER7_15110 [Bacteroidota bacterium]